MRLKNKKRIFHIKLNFTAIHSQPGNIYDNGLCHQTDVAELCHSQISGYSSEKSMYILRSICVCFQVTAYTYKRYEE